jgi:hypothetical protein
LAFSLPIVTKADWKNLKGIEKYGAHFFNGLGRMSLVRPILLIVSPVLQVVAGHAAITSMQSGEATRAKIGGYA